MIRPLIIVSVLGVALAACATPFSQQSEPARPAGAENDSVREASAIAAVERFLSAIETQDTSIWEDMLLPDAGAVAWAETPDGDRMITIPADRLRTFMDDQEPSQESEPIWAPTVLLRGPMAVVWTPYEFLRDGARTHCGVDVFILHDVEGAWKISASSWTMERTTCADLDAAR